MPENSTKLLGDPTQTEENWLCCCDVLPEYVAHLPAGKIQPIYGGTIWVDAYGKHYTAEEFYAVHGVKPDLAWAAIKEYRKKYGGGVHIVKE